MSPLHEHVVRIAVEGRQRVEIAGVGQRIEVDDAYAALHRLKYEIATDKTGTAGDKPS